MTSAWLRKKHGKAEVALVNINNIIGFDLFLHEEYKEYVLHINLSSTAIIEWHVGTFDECHMELNKITSKLDLKIIDL